LNIFNEREKPDLVDHLGIHNDKNLYEITKLIKNEKKAVIILAATKDEPLSAEQIVEQCGISAIQCHRLLRKLRELGLVKLVKSTSSDGTSESEIFLYQAELTPDLIRYENGRFKIRFPEKLNISRDEQIDVKAFIKSTSKK
jgi:transcription initiation factor IIE alpha subunit